MITFQRVQSILTAIACVGMLTPTSALYAEQTAKPTQSKIADVALGTGGLLAGTVVKADGSPVPGAHIVLRSKERTLVDTTTADDGSFRIHALRGGVYDMNANGNVSVMRLWAPQTAPPSSAKTVTLIAGEEIVRGQSCTNGSCTAPGGCDCNECVGGAYGSAPWAFLMNPMVIGAVVAAAVAIPLALDDDGDAS